MGDISSESPTISETTQFQNVTSAAHEGLIVID